MEIYRVIITPLAQEDIISIAKYLCGFSIEIALRYYDLIDEAITSLETMPYRCSLVQSEKLRKKGYRWLSVRNYTVFFRITKKVVRVERILHSLQEYDAIL